MDSPVPVLALYDPFGIDVPLNFDTMKPMAVGSKVRLKFIAARTLIRIFTALYQWNRPRSDIQAPEVNNCTGT